MEMTELQVKKTRAVLDELFEERVHSYGRGYTPQHDREIHANGELKDAAVAIILAPVGSCCPPWVHYIIKKWKGDQRKRLIIAANLLIGEIERLDSDVKGITMTTDGERLGEVIQLMRATDFSKPMFNVAVYPTGDNERMIMTTNNELPPCKECGMMPIEETSYPYWKLHKPWTGCKYSEANIGMTDKMWRAIHTPDPRIAELTARVHELEKLLEESHVVAAALDMELRALKARQPIWDTIAQAADAIPEER